MIHVTTHSPLFLWLRDPSGTLRSFVLWVSILDTPFCKSMYL